jgi:poly(A) polymerase
MTASIKRLPSLRKAAWLNEPRLQEVMAVITRGGGEVRVAGGAVRNALLGVPIADVDLATTMLPADVMHVCKAAGFGVHPTGFEHGTVTVVNDGVPFEVTTLRRDVETDGRRAVVAFTSDWAEDALRRDFTMNAMYCDADGKIYDFTNGYVDLLRNRIRFVGDANMRIKEDYLRVLRFFRFHARFGKAAPDKTGLAACAKLKSGLKKISAERIRQEMFKLVVAPRAVPTLKIMAASGVLKIIIPYTDDWRLVGRLPDDAVLRLYGLAKKPEELKDILRLSNVEAQRFDELMLAPDLSPRLKPQEQRAMLYHLGGQAWFDAVQLNWAKGRASKADPKWQALLDLPKRWPIPKLPINGQDMLAAGIASGPQMGEMLRELEDWWVACDFVATREELLERLKHDA